MAKGRVLVVDDALEMANTIVESLQRHGFAAEAANSGPAGLERFKDAPADVVLTDLRMKGMDGLDLLAGIHALDADVPVIIMTAFGAVDSAVEAIQRGAYHYVTKPFKLEVVRVLIERALKERAVRAENEELRRTVRETQIANNMVGRSDAMRVVVDLVRRVAATTAPVLVLGETGTGKELVARAVHAESPRKDAPFVAVNCAALPEALLESELFGHVRGAFTGATQARSGLFLEANGGTLLLDEIGEMPLLLQAKLLRVLETGALRSVGSDAERRIDVRIVASTNRDLAALVKETRFRQDLFFRLNVVPIVVPPLRARREDIPLLLEHFLRRSRVMAPASPVTGFAPAAMKLLLDYAWPGNIRELEKLVDRWVITGQAPEVSPEEVKAALGEWDDPLETAHRDLVPLAVVEQRYIAWVMDRVGGNKTRAAQILQIDPSTIYRKGKQGKT
jgi:two-component system response regulator HydG